MLIPLTSPSYLQGLLDLKFATISPKPASDIFDVFAALAVQNVRNEEAEEYLLLKADYIRLVFPRRCAASGVGESEPA